MIVPVPQTFLKTMKNLLGLTFFSLVVGVRIDGPLRKYETPIQGFAKASRKGENLVYAVDLRQASTESCDLTKYFRNTPADVKEDQIHVAFTGPDEAGYPQVGSGPEPP